MSCKLRCISNRHFIGIISFMQFLFHPLDQHACRLFNSSNYVLLMPALMESTLMWARVQ